MKPNKSKPASRRPTRRTTEGSRTPSASEELHKRIAKRAYEIYEQRIRQGALDDWLQAEREILGHKGGN